MEVVCIPPDMLGAFWPLLEPWLIKGQLLLTPDLREAVLELRGMLDSVKKNRAWIWAVLEDATHRCHAAMFAELYLEGGEHKTLLISRMGGEKILRWGKALSKAINDYAKAEGCISVRFWGRRGLERAYKGAAPILDLGDNLYLYEGFPK
jgi:hypothetical protein